MDIDHKTILSSKQAFKAYYLRERDELLGYFVKRVKTLSDAEELMHDTFLSFLDSLPLFEGKSSLKTYLYSIARHELADYWRKKYAKKAIHYLPLISGLYTEKLYSSFETKLAIDEAMRAISVESADILRMKYVLGLGVGEIAQKLSISVKAAESRLFRARKSFSKAYAATNI